MESFVFLPLKHTFTFYEENQREYEQAFCPPHVNFSLPEMMSSLSYKQAQHQSQESQINGKLYNNCKEKNKQ